MDSDRQSGKRGSYDIHAFLTEMQKRKIDCGPVQDQGWGVLTEVTSPSGGKLHVYQPRHKRPTLA